MKIPVLVAIIAGLIATPLGYSADQPPPPMVKGLNHPAAVAIASAGKTYVTAKREINKDSDGQGGLGGAVLRIENGKAMPTLSSLARLAAALEIDICNLLRDARSRRHEETASILGDPFLAELAPYISQMDSLQRSMFLNQVRDLALGRRRSA